MNCETIDSLLDDHLVARLSPTERQRAAEHVGGCARCSAAWAADDALRGEAIADPVPELFAALLRRVSAAPVQSETAHRSRWPWIAGAAAAVVIVAVAAQLATPPSVGKTILLKLNATTMRLGEVAQDVEAVLAPDGPPDGAGRPEAASPPATVASSPFVAGRDYEVLTGGAVRLGAPAPAGTVEVVEFFMFECFPCYAFEADLNRWEAETRSSVSLTRVPAMFSPAARLHARAYYTAEALGKLDAMRAEIYDEIHLRENPLDSRDLIADFFGRSGVDRATFDATFDSSEVDARFQRAVALNGEYRVQVTPTIVVAGRYSTDPGLAGSQILEVVDQLVADERRCQTRCDGVRPVIPEQPR
jgi:thiol:disulfide interchange protein DsbA